jgi:hypothetical protein
LTVIEHVDGNDNALRAESSRRLFNEAGILKCDRVDYDFVGARREALLDVLQRPDSATERKRHETHPRHFPQDVDRAGPLVALLDIVAAKIVEIVRANVEQNQLVDVPVGQPLNRAHRVADDLMGPERLASN